MQPTPKKQTSPWMYIGCGCAGLVVLAMAGMAVMTANPLGRPGSAPGARLKLPTRRRTAAAQAPTTAAFASACSRSAHRSSTVSMPAETRTRPSGMPARLRPSGPIIL